MRGFTKTGQPIQGRRYVIAQPPDVPPTECVVVGKLYGRGGNSDLVGIIIEETKSGGRVHFPWPIEAAPGTAPITLRAAP